MIFYGFLSRRSSHPDEVPQAKRCRPQNLSRLHQRLRLTDASTIPLSPFSAATNSGVEPYRPWHSGWLHGKEELHLLSRIRNHESTVAVRRLRVGALIQKELQDF